MLISDESYPLDYEQELTDRMLDVVNQGLSGVSVPALADIARGLMLASGVQGARQVGDMLYKLVELNREYSEILVGREILGGGR